jgi:hypothetical protein
MAITKTNFTGQTLAAQAPEVLAFMQANAADYFDTIEADTNGNVKCYVGEVLAFQIGMDSSTVRKVTLANGTSIQSNAADAYRQLLSYGKKTANGILLVFQGANTGMGNMAFFITKNELGDTCIFGDMKGVNSSTTTTYFCADIKNDTNFLKLLDNAQKSSLAMLSRAANVTSLAPIVFNSGHYAPKAYIAAFNQFALIDCDVSLQGRSYASDGVCMLSD